MGTGWFRGRRSIRTWIVVGFAISAFLILGGAGQAPTGLLYFKATADKDIYTKNPDNYDPIALPPDSATDTVYVERAPALRIRLDEIRSAIIEEKPVPRTPDEAARQLLGIESKEKKGKDAKKRDVYYTATFVLTGQAAGRLNDFAQKHERELFDVRLGTRRLNVVTFLGPFRSDQTALLLAERDRSRIKSIFSPIRDKVIWK